MRTHTKGTFAAEAERLDMHVRAIETRYSGYRFRSRLEARWAVFFDALNLWWEYEPEGFELPSGRYLPDFLVHTPWLEFGARVEVKPTAPSPLELKLLAEATEHTLGKYMWRSGVMLIGAPGAQRCIEINRDGKARDLGGVVSMSLTLCRPGGLVSAADLAAAVEAARGARFEHGESGPRGGRR